MSEDVYRGVVVDVAKGLKELRKREVSFLVELGDKIFDWAGSDDSKIDFVTKESSPDGSDIITHTFEMKWEHKGCNIELVISSISSLCEWLTVDDEDHGKLFKEFNIFANYKNMKPKKMGFYVEFLKVEYKCRGKHFGANVLKYMLSLADKHDVYLMWDYDKDVEISEKTGSKAIKNLKAWYAKSGALFSPIASELGWWDFVYPDYILPIYKNLKPDLTEHIERLNPINMGGWLPKGIPRKWYFKAHHYSAMKEEIKASEKRNVGISADDIEDMVERFTENALKEVLSNMGYPFIGGENVYGSYGYGIGDPLSFIHKKREVYIFPAVLTQTEYYDWILLKWTGYTGDIQYEEVSIFSTEELLNKLEEKTLEDLI